MILKDELMQDLEAARRDFHHLLDSVPEVFYHHPSSNPAWTIGDVLYHITLGPPALRFEIWMVIHANRLFQLALNEFTAKVFNRVNAIFARHPKRITRQSLLKAYEAGHAGLTSSLKRASEEDLKKSVTYPEAFVTELAGQISAEHLYRYVRGHFEIHAEQIRNSTKDSK